jgi:branched-chain amino acid aminotransferase
MHQQPNRQLEIAVWRIEIEPQGSFHLQSVNLYPSPKSLDAASLMLPQGVYTTFRTFDGDKILSLHDQAYRLEQSASLVGCPIHIEINWLREILRKVVRPFPSQEKRVRLSVDLKTGSIYVLIEPLQVPSKSQYEHGVRVVTVLRQRHNPKAKQTQFIEIADAIRKDYPEDINDLLMVDDDGFILEGLNSNFFAVRNNEIFTAEENVLSGITREAVLKVIRQLGIALYLTPVHINDLGQVREAFLTSASRSVLPIAKIDQIRIEGSIPGLITKSIREEYWNYVNARLENL